MFSTHLRRPADELLGPKSACQRAFNTPPDRLLERRAGSHDAARHDTVFTVIDHVHGRRWARQTSKLDLNDIAGFEQALLASLDGAVHGHAIGLPRSWLRYGTAGRRLIVRVFDDGLALWVAATGAHMLLDPLCPAAEFLRNLTPRSVPSCWCMRRPLLTFAGSGCIPVAASI